MKVMSQYLVNGPVESGRIAAEIARAGNLKSSGGHSVFMGQVRDDLIDGKRVEAIEYSAYEPLVSKEAEKIKNEIFAEFSEVDSAVIIHSTGIVKTGEISLFVMVSAGHRNQAISACREMVERIKERLPVWKKEILSDKTYQWKENG
jgi:molybdopterin synthase catalytic subunit